MVRGGGANGAWRGRRRPATEPRNKMNATVQISGNAHIAHAGISGAPGRVTRVTRVTRAVPQADTRTPVYLLGTSTSSARFAGSLGLPYAYAHQINPAGTVAALEAYRNAFEPSAWLDHPYTIVAPTVIVADSDERAQWLARGFAAGRLLVRTEDRFPLFPTAEEAGRRSFAPEGERFIRERLDPQFIGGPGTVRDRLTELVKHSGADELMALTMVSDHEARVRSYELLAELVRS
ncbi:LLM class flavin-dependent oxidoreductase [Streptosporangium vulgare]|uniref:LLM class flavin-dependent oxidoreductase n=1 Tax=Streptosporangium vulgare TaxID=46190 RepID=A0ABV5TQP7_9ACTN